MNKLRYRHPVMDAHGNMTYVTDLAVGINAGGHEMSVTFTVTSSRAKNVSAEKWVCVIDQNGIHGIGDSQGGAEEALMRQIVFAAPSFDKSQYIPIAHFGRKTV